MLKSFTDGFSGWIIGKADKDETSAEATKNSTSSIDRVSGTADAEEHNSNAPESGAISLKGTTFEVPVDSKSTSKDEKSQSSFSDAVKLDELTGAAKQWGTYLLNVGKAATKTVAGKALEIKKSVEEKTILGDFAKEQEKFVNEKRERQKHSEAAVPPWVGYNEEEAMKQQILGLSTDKRNFLRNPPAGVQFQFDYETCYPVAMAMLNEDENLQKMRFDLVPKQVNEHDFWRNYFYRVSLIKQSTQLTSMTKQSTQLTSMTKQSVSRSYDPTALIATSGGGGGSTRAVATESKSSPKTSSVNKNEIKSKTDEVDDVASLVKGEELAASPPTSLAQDEFISDDYQGEINDDELRKEMEALRMKDAKAKERPREEATEWEQELQKELNEYEVIGGSGGGEELDDMDEAELEKEILEQIADESQK